MNNDMLERAAINLCISRRQNPNEIVFLESDSLAALRGTRLTAAKREIRKHLEVIDAINSAGQTHLT